MAVIWKVRPTPSRQTQARRQPGDRPAVEGDGAGVGLELAVQHVEAGALAGAVGADQRQHFAGGEIEVDAGHRLDAAERLAQAADRQQHHVASSLPLLPGPSSGAIRSWA